MAHQRTCGALCLILLPAALGFRIKQRQKDVSPSTKTSTAAGPTTRPNLVMMIIDDLGWADVGYHGSNFSTPKIDDLAAQGVQLDRFYVQASCAPSRAALMTARLPHKIGMQHCNGIWPASNLALPLTVPTIAELLKADGYTTAAIGKWHLGYGSWKNVPTARGFDSFAGFLAGKTDFYKRELSVNGRNGKDVWRNTTFAGDEIGRYSTEFYQEEAERFLGARDSSKPFFIYYAHQLLHNPLETPPGTEHADACAHLNAHWRNVLCQMANNMDKAVGDFVDMLKNHGVWDNTLMWFASNNGGLPGPPGQSGVFSASSNWPLRGGRNTHWEGGVRVPSFVTGGLLPAQAAGTKYTGLLHHVDIPATMLAMAGVSAPNADGLDVWDAVTRNEPSPRTEVVVNLDSSSLAGMCKDAADAYATRAASLGPLSLHDLEAILQSASAVNHTALIQGDWKLLYGWVGPRDGYWSNEPYTYTEAETESVRLFGEEVSLFNLIADPEERDNVAASNQDVVSQMLARIKELYKEYSPPANQEVVWSALPSFWNNYTWKPYKN